MKSMLQCNLYFWKLQWKLDKAGILLVILPRVLDTVNTFAVAVFPGLIIDSLVENQGEKGIFLIILFALAEFANNGAKALLNRSINIHKESFSSGLNHMLVEKTTMLRQEQLEHPEIFEQYELARKCANENSVPDYFGQMLSLVFGVVKLCGFLYLLKEMPLWVLAPFVFATLVHVAAKRKIDKNIFEEEEAMIPGERKLGYLHYELPKPEYAKEIRLFGMKPFLISKEHETRTEYTAGIRSFGETNKQALQAADIAGRVLSVIFYACNIFRYAAGEMTVGMFTITINAMFQFSASVNDIVSTITGFALKTDRMEKVRSFLDTPDTHTGTAEAAVFEQGGWIEFVDVSYRYPGVEGYALENVSMRIEYGEKIAIVGPNGAGKTTFVALMLGLYKPASGNILYNGVDIEDLDYEGYKRLFSFLPQDFQIFSFTVLDNILFSVNPSEEEYAVALECIEKAGLEPVVEKLPDREKTYLTRRFDSRGVEVSGGERQKISIARILKRDSAIFILDEPTSALDPQNEYDIYGRFSKATEGKTVLFVSHRLSSCKLCDRIIVFQNGRLVEDGRHEDLIKNGGLYAEMYAKQAESYL